MSCLNLRLPTARKSWWNWKSLTSKIQRKLHKLNKPKAITKPRSNRPKTAPSRRHYKLLGARFQRKRRPKSHLVLVQNRRQCHVLQKGHAPVYVDKLFKGSVSERVDQILQPLPQKSPGTSKEGGNGPEKAGCAAADDMWEALGFASPQMRGIDERAEQFIAKFRAEMKVQEMLARDL